MHNPKGSWRMCLAATVSLFCIVGLTINAFSVYQPYLQARCALSNTQAANYIVVRSLFAFASLFLVGKFYDKLDIRLGLTTALVLSAASFALYAWAEQFWQLCLAAAVAGLAFGLGGMYPASLLISRWFHTHSALALGICSAGSGLAAIVGAPVITALAENYSVQTALLTEAAVLLVGAAACFFLIQNWPRDAVRTEKQTQSGGISVRVTWMFAAVVAIGVLGNTGFQYLTMHFTARDFTPYQVSVLVSVLGTALMASKFLFGEAVDRWGAYRSNWMFFGSTILGCVLCCVAGGYGLAMGAVLLYGLGLAFGTVGLTVYAKDLSSPEEFADIVRQNQIAYLLGALLFGSVPGLLADWTGSYTAFYGLLTVLAVFAMVVVQRSYHKKSTSI